MDKGLKYRRFAMNIYIIVGNSINLKTYHFLPSSKIAAVDKGCMLALRSKINLDYAIGDFDSLPSNQVEIVKNCAKHFIQLSPIKDVTDTYQAYRLLESGADKIIILGGLQGRRVEHLLANINLLRLDKRVIIEDDNSLIFRVDGPTNLLIKPDMHKYFSLFALQDSLISLTGFAYELDHYLLTPADSLCISNQVISSPAILDVFSGSCLVVQSKDDIDF